MPIISINADYVQGYANLEIQVRTQAYEIAQFIQVRVLQNPDYQEFIGSFYGELQQIVITLQQGGQIYDDDIRTLSRIAEQVRGLNGYGGYRPGWFNPGYFGGGVAGVSIGIGLSSGFGGYGGRTFIDDFFRQPRSFVNIGGYVNRFSRGRRGWDDYDFGRFDRFDCFNDYDRFSGGYGGFPGYVNIV